MILKIEKGQDNPILRQKAKKVKEIIPDIKQLILDMIETIKSNSNNIGLAAPQIGYSLRIIAVKTLPDESILVLINPEIKKKSFRKEILKEGCLSLPNFFAPVKRSKEITIQGLNPEGQLIKIKTKGLLSRILQHEINHLDGVLICDKV
ncbi:peptide deformylase [Patescibacteria group bacterium]|nr:peptide deformylase [Patescibacteria group bacterium]MBU1563460.1 peptide deformylase [Patescibacteria group bacterium]